MTLLATLVLTSAQIMRINYVLQEAPNGLAIRSAAIFLVESSAGEDKRRRDVSSHGWFQLQVKTACLMDGYGMYWDSQPISACPISARQLETDTELNTRLGLAYIQYCAENFPASEARQIACHRWGVPKTRAMKDSKLKRLEEKGGYVWKVLQTERALEVREDHD